uniref:Peptidase A2 domain-containing protein n=1 Tax=Schistosoma curassoni TaxID=6186 RepID=A0A183KAM0_9TREM
MLLITPVETVVIDVVGMGNVFCNVLLLDVFINWSDDEEIKGWIHIGENGIDGKEENFLYMLLLLLVKVGLLVPLSQLSVIVLTTEFGALFEVGGLTECDIVSGGITLVTLLDTGSVINAFRLNDD